MARSCDKYGVCMVRLGEGSEDDNDDSDDDYESCNIGCNF